LRAVIRPLYFHVVWTILTATLRKYIPGACAHLPNIIRQSEKFLAQNL